MWKLFASPPETAQPAENLSVFRFFSSGLRTGRSGEDCYTFERFASSPDVIRTTYYYHYKRKRLGLKEEAPWN
ncbi:MAG TPA: hypothetical protein VF824_22035 [Thermoanaerobaculia bacterium]|jgi:hypothetical protein